MFRTFPRIPVLAGILMLVSLPGCSVWEDRDLCPAQLLLQLPPRDGPLVLVLETVQGNRADTLAAGDTVYRAIVPRGPLQVKAACPPEGFSPSSGTLWIPEGNACPETLLGLQSYDLEGESLCDSVRLHKHFCRLDIRIVCRTGAFPYSFAVSGEVAGLAADGAPVPGVFRCRVRPGPDGTCQVCLPRQSDDSLILEILSEDGPLRSFALGEFLAEAGYDWTAEDLEDAAVEVDYSRTFLTLRTEGWEKTFRFDIVI